MLAGIKWRLLIALLASMVSSSQSFGLGMDAEPTAAPSVSERAWPHLRGAHYDAAARSCRLADAWPPQGPPILWHRALGQGFSGFIVVDGRAYTQVQTLYSQAVICLDANTSTTVWEQRYDWPYEAAGLYPGPRSTPTWSAGQIYFAGPRGHVGCLNAADGSLLWSLNVNEKFGGRGAEFGVAASPLIEEGKVILPVGGPEASVVALDAKTGATVWTSGDEPASYSSVIPITLAGRRVVVALLRNALACFDLGSGRRLWQQNYSHGYDEHAAFPLYKEPFLLIASPFKEGAKLYRLAPGPNDTVSVQLAWQNKNLSNDVASSILLDGCVYGFDLHEIQAKLQRPSRGAFRCLDLQTGNVLWSSEQTGHASVLAADGKLVLFNDRGELLLARASPTRYEALARAPIFGGEICWTAPALSNGRLFIRTQSQAACVYLGLSEQLTPAEREHVRPASSLPKSRPTDAWVNAVGGEREYPFDAPTPEELRRWFTFCIGGVFAVAAAGAGLALAAAWAIGANGACVHQATFWSLCFLMGVIGTPVYNQLFGPFILTWPAALFTGYQLTLLAAVRVSADPRNRQRRWTSRAAGLGFLALCALYFHACRRLSMAMEAAFLVGFLPAFPIAVLAARQLRRSRKVLIQLLWVLASFSTYYWLCAGFIRWR